MEVESWPYIILKKWLNPFLLTIYTVFVSAMPNVSHQNKKNIMKKALSGAKIKLIPQLFYYENKYLVYHMQLKFF